jgi:hypothetical protein
MTERPWRIRPYRPGDERALVALWTEAFGRPMSEAHWRWKAKGRPSPVENVGVAVDGDDRPIFQFVGIPCPAIVLGRPRTVMVGADVVTAPEFRARGVFTATARRLFDSWRAAGVALILGLANDRWRSRADVLGYERYFRLERLIRPLHPERLLARKTRLAAARRLSGVARLWNWTWDRSAPRDIVVRELERATPEIDALWARAAGAVRTSLVRDRAWVAWRYCDIPERAYRVTLAERNGIPSGYAAYRLVPGEHGAAVHLPEVFAPGDRMVFRALVRDVVQRAIAHDADSILTLATPGTTAHRELARAGFLFARGGWPLEVVRLDETIARAPLRDPTAWWLAGGDFDVI